MGLRFDPVGGGQFKQAVKAIVEAERQPIKQIEARKAKVESKLKLFQEFKGKFAGFEKTLSEFANFRSFRELKADLGDGANFVSVTIDKDRAETGTYAITVDSLASRSSVISNGFSDAEKPVIGSGFIVVNQPDGNSREIFVDAANGSLKGIANLINKQEDFPIHASVIKDVTDADAPWKLIVSAKKDGEGANIEIPDFYFIDGERDLYIDDSKEYEGAKIKVDGFPITAESNEIKDFVNGVNLHLKQPRPDAPITLNITEDYQKVSGKMKGMIDQINGILEFINKQNQVDDKSDTGTTFAGDTSLQTIEYRLRNLLHEGFPANDWRSDNVRYLFLNQLGVEFDKTGKIGFKEEKFQKVLETDFAGVSEAITGTYGIASQLREVVQGYTRAGDGLLSVREQGMRSQIRKFDEDIGSKEQRLERRQQALTEQFSRLQGSLAAMQQQQSALGAMGGGGGGNMVAQLLGG